MQIEVIDEKTKQELLEQHQMETAIEGVLPKKWRRFYFVGFSPKDKILKR